MDKIFLDDFRKTIESSAEQLLRIPEKQSEVPKAEGKWSPKEIIGHLIDSAANNHPRFVRAQFKEDLVFPGYDQEQWVSAQHYNASSWEALIGLWKRYNEHLVHVISYIPEPQLTRLHKEHSLNRIAWITVSEGKPASLEYLIRDYVDHLKHHLGQILTNGTSSSEHSQDPRLSRV
jgi:hypothetical protein